MLEKIVKYAGFCTSVHYLGIADTGAYSTIVAWYLTAPVFVHEQCRVNVVLSSTIVLDRLHAVPLLHRCRDEVKIRHVE